MKPATYSWTKRIQAVAKGRDQRPVSLKLHLRNCYTIKGYACMEPDKYTSTVSHQAYMRIGAASVFTPIADTPELPSEYSEFVSRRRLGQLHIKLKDQPGTQDRVIIDYIGILQKMHDSYTNAGKPYVTLTLKDCSNTEVTVRLWEEITTSSTRFPRAAIEISNQPTILALTALRMTDFMGKLQIQSTKNATHIYLNPSTMETLTPGFRHTESHADKPGAQENNTTISQLEAKDMNDLKNMIDHLSRMELNGFAQCIYRIMATVSDTRWIRVLRYTALRKILNRQAVFHINAQKNSRTGAPRCTVINNSKITAQPANKKNIVPRTKFISRQEAKDRLEKSIFSIS